MEDKLLLALSCIICLTVLEVVALLCGLDGQLFSVIVGAMCTLFGLAVGTKIIKIKEGKRN